MFDLDDAHAETEKADGKDTSSTRSRRRGLGYVVDIAIVLLMGSVLFWGATTQFPNQFNDATRYQCYAVAFWQGSPALASLPPQQCAFLDASASSTLATK